MKKTIINKTLVQTSRDKWELWGLRTEIAERELKMALEASDKFGCTPEVMKEIKRADKHYDYCVENTAFWVKFWQKALKAAKEA